MSDLLTFCRDRTDDLLAELTTLVGYESFSRDKAATDQLVTYVAGQLSALGAAVERLSREHVGDLLLAKWNTGAPGKPITFLAHLDTVWPVGTLALRPVRCEDGRCYGPGAADMKGGVVAMLGAIKALQERGEFPNRPIWALVTPDEEIGSPYSRETIIEVGKQSGLVLVMEPGTPDGALKTWRKGVVDYTLRVTGRASHAGAAPEQGINAVVELAHQIIRLNQLNDLKNGTSVTVTMISGGHTNNVIPDHAEAYVDVRFLTQAASDRIDAAISALYPTQPGAVLEFDKGDHRPPMERDDQMRATFAQVKAIAESIGVSVFEGGSGGGSDGNFTAAAGTPTIDGMGPTGDGLHAEHENFLISSLVEKTALVAAILRDWEM
ncbi:MAG: M20 family metallopeptidase [Anaerolineae bacterium]|nr:M20 family metallopeptidase [Anaerolineae bacterium]